LVPVKARR